MNEKKFDSSQAEGTSLDDSSYKVLARKYRPQIFSELVGQDALVRTMTNAIREDRIAHSFILTGVRGVGKTTAARIIARSLNCIGADGSGGPTVSPCGVCGHCKAIADSRDVDVLEMDAASRTGVDNIRELLDGVRYLPTSARYKIYIIDEVHMLSIAAFNALLKTLEEPPPHVIFIFATTEIRKLPVTVLSRCQRFDLRRISAEQLVAHFTSVAEAEGVNAEEEALKLIAGASEGSVRDGLSLLDQAIAHCGGQVAVDEVRDMLGLADRTRIYDLFEALMKGKLENVLAQLRDQYDLGTEPEVILRDLLELTHLLTRFQVSSEAGNDPGLSKIEQERSDALAKRLSMPVLARSWQMLLKGLEEVRVAPFPLAAAEMVLIRLAYSTDLPTPSEAVRQVIDQRQAKPSISSAPTQVSSLPSRTASSRPQSARPIGQAIAVAAAPETNQEILSTPKPSNSKTLENFGALVARAEADDVRLYHHLMADVSLVEFKPGYLEFSPGNKAPTDLANNLRGKLEDWTGDTWSVVVNSQKEGQPPLADQHRQAESEMRARVENDPLVKAVLETFPGAEVTNLRPLEGSVNAMHDMTRQKHEFK